MLYDKIRHLTLEDSINIEESDRQFKALKKLHKKIDNKYYLQLIIANSLICYQLSWKWEDYWEEFSEYFSSKNFENLEDLIESIKEFLPKSKNNKRFVRIKSKRLDKSLNILRELLWKEAFYYKNMLTLRDLIAKNMNQQKDAKTVVFAIKMFSYWARNIFWRELYPKEIKIPIDSRLIKLHEIYWKWEVMSFYDDVSARTWLPPLHLDPIIWINYDKLINNERI